MWCETVHSQCCTTFFRHSAVLSVPAVLLHKLPNDDLGMEQSRCSSIISIKHTSASTELRELFLTLCNTPLLYLVRRFYADDCVAAAVRNKNYLFSFVVLKKMKHRIVEHMSSSTADALGLSRAILCNGRLYFNN